MAIEIIAEIGQNHDGNFDIALDLIRGAKAAGADVVKFQAFDARKLFSSEGNPWYDYNCRSELSLDQFRDLKKFCDDVEIEFMVSVFDTERVQWFEDLGVQRYKVASRSVQDKPLLDALVETKKPLIVSTGYLQRGFLPIINSGAQLDYLFCISNYPTQLDEVALDEIDFKKMYAGFSDHTVGISASVIAMSRGARIIEKHLTHDTSAYGPDHACSVTLDELSRLVGWRRDVEKVLYSV